MSSITPLPALMALAMAAPAAALEPTCETYLAAVEKSARQPARQSVTEADGTRMQAVIVDGVLYSEIGGKWRKLNSEFSKAEKALTADIRSGRIKLDQCSRLGDETIDGAAMTVIEYSLTMPGAEAARSKAYIGSDGLLYAQTADDARVRFRYRDVVAPKL
jgi:hypothetical protein